MFTEWIPIFILLVVVLREATASLERECNCTKNLDKEVAQLSELIQLHTEKLSNLVKYERQTDRLSDWYSQIHRRINGILERDSADLRNEQINYGMVPALEMVDQYRNGLANCTAEFKSLVSNLDEKMRRLDQVLYRPPNESTREEQRLFHEDQTLEMHLNATRKKLKETDILVRQMSMLLTKLNIDQRLKQLESRMRSVEGEIFAQWSDFRHNLKMNEHFWNTGAGQASLSDVVGLLVARIEKLQHFESIPASDYQDFVAPFNDLPGARLVPDL